MGHSVPWDVLRVGLLVMGRLVMGRFENGTFQELDLLYVHLTRDTITSILTRDMATNTY
jgi:hypothetical protein